MKILRTVFARIWAFWGLLSFSITFLLFFLPAMVAYAIRDEWRSQRYFIGVSRWWMNVWLSLIGCSVGIYGRQNFKAGNTYVVVFNHNALLDVPLSAPYVPGANRTIAKSSFAKVPIFGWYYSKGSVLVDRQNEQSRVKSYEAMKNTLKAGIHMCIYPEGTRNRTGKPLKQFYDGAFKLAVDCEKDIIPCIISGTTKAMPITETFYLLPQPLKLEFLPAVSSAEKTAKQLKDEVFDIMHDAITKGKTTGR
jgi:1-acyl-sn-glycerol-3-phosphate acyltransferase